jgi:peptidoglycan/LPS O-acetylase OafA/YrhL
MWVEPAREGSGIDMSNGEKGSAKRFDALDGLRGACACIVVFYHLKSTGTLTSLPLFRNGWLMVDIFFVLSGFVINATYREKLTSGYPLKYFMLLRLGRVYPLHIFMIALFLALEFAGLLVGTHGATVRLPFTESRSIQSLWENLLLLQVFGLDKDVTWNGPSWSIAAEVWTYLAVAAVLSLSPRRSTAIFAGITLAAPLVLVSVGSRYLDYTFSWSVVRCLYGFCLGMLAHQMYLKVSAKSRAGDTAVSFAQIIAVISSACFIWYEKETAMQLLCPPLFAATILTLSFEGGLIARALRQRPFQLLGLWSYSIYMIHYFVISRALDVLTFVGRKAHINLVEISRVNGLSSKVLTGPSALPDFLAVAILCSVIALSVLTYRWIEVPFRNASRRFVQRSSTDGTPADEARAPSI